MALQLFVGLIEQLKINLRIAFANAGKLAADDHFFQIVVHVVGTVAGYGDARQAGQPDVGQRNAAVQIAFVASHHLQADNHAIDRFVG